MKPIERNEPCPCGSGKKYKKCHLGRENEILFNEPDEISVEMSKRITDLPTVFYGKSKDIQKTLNIKKLTNSSIGIKFVDLEEYSKRSFFGNKLPEEGSSGGGSVFVNIYKTQKSDPKNIYIAISPSVDDSVILHQVAHALDYISGSKLMPGSQKPLSLELEIPVEHLEHPHEFGYWLDYLQKEYNVKLDADDSIIAFLYKNDKLLKGEEIQKQDKLILKLKSEKILTFLSENSVKIDELIQECKGYIGPQSQNS